MKQVLIFFTFIALVIADWTPRTKEQFFKDRDECFKIENISEHCIDEIKRHVFPEDPRCYFRCISVRGGVWDDKTGLDIDKAYEELTNANLETSKENLNKCNTEKEKDDDPCKWSANVVKCMWENKYVKKKRD